MNPVVFFRQGIFCKMMKISFKMIVVIIASRNNIYSHTYKIYLNILYRFLSLKVKEKMKIIDDDKKRSCFS